MANVHLTMRKKKVLLLEDEEVLGKLYVKEMKEAGYETLWLQSTENVVQEAARFSPDLMLLDNTIRGEDISGVDLIPALKEVLPKVPIIILSNYDHFQLEQEGEARKSVSHLLKIDTPPTILVKQMKDLLYS